MHVSKSNNEFIQMNSVPWKTEEQCSVIDYCICCVFLVRFNATVAGNGCTDEEVAYKRITVANTARGVP